jgi:Tol biopolymer transport system component
MSDTPPPPASPDSSAEDTRLDSWKEIAVYLKRDVTTVRRWEKREGLPVRRHLHGKLGSVYAQTSDIDEWWRRRSALGAPLEPVTTVSAPVQRLHSAVGWIVAAGLAAVALLAMELAWSPAGRTDAQLVRFQIFPPDGADLTSVALSPDGTQIAMAATSSRGATRIWKRSMDQITPEPLYGTEGGAFPFWSPDGRWIGFFGNRKLKKISLATREVRDIADAPNGRGGSWNEQDVIVFAPDRDRPLLRVSAGGGAVAALTALHRKGARGHVWPEFLPDGRHFLYLDDRFEPDGHGIYVGDLQSNTTAFVMKTYSNAAPLPEGRVIFAADDRLVAQPLDRRTWQLTGEPTMIATMPMMQYGLDHRVDFTVSRTGALAFRQEADARKRLTWFDRSGRVEATFGEPAMYGSPAIAADGRRAAVVVADADPRQLRAEIWLVDTQRGALTPMTMNHAFNFSPVWSPAGDRVLFTSNQSGRFQVYEKTIADGIERPFAIRLQGTPEGWSKDGRFVTASMTQRDTRSDAWAWPLQGGRPMAIARSARNEGQSQISPDGRFVAYTSDESGRLEVLVKTFPDLKHVWRSATGGADPRWRGDGRELFYISADRRLMAVPVGPTLTQAWRPPEPLFDVKVDDLWEDSRNHYDVTADGRHFLMPVLASTPAHDPFTVVVRAAPGNPVALLQPPAGTMPSIVRK